MFKATLVVVFTTLFMISSAQAKKCSNLLASFVDHGNVPHRDITILIEQGSPAKNNSEIRDFIRIQPTPFWSHAMFVEDFLFATGRYPKVRDAFKDVMKEVHALQKKIETLKFKYPEYERSFNPTLHSISIIKRFANKNLTAKKYNLDHQFDPSKHFHLIETGITNTLMGELGELKVALAREDIIARSVKPLSRSGSFGKRMKVLMDDMNERLDIASRLLEHELKTNPKRLKFYKEKYSRLMGTINTDNIDEFINLLVKKIQSKEIDIVTEEEGNTFLFHEVKFAERAVGSNRTYGHHDRAKIVKQIRLTQNIIDFLGLTDVIKQELVFPFGVDSLLADKLNELKVGFDGQVMESHIIND